MVDRAARDWMVTLIQGALTGPIDPRANYTIDPGPCLKSKDPIIQDAMEALDGFLNAHVQLNSAGTAPVITNLDDARRQMRILITFLRSDLPYESPRWPAIGCSVALTLVGITVLIAFVASPPWSTRSMAILQTLAYMGMCVIPLLIFLTLASFIWQRWVRPPKRLTDESDHWPFNSFADLQAQRNKQNPPTP